MRLLYDENLSPRPHGAPPKVIWLHVGNAPTRDIETLLLARRDRIESFFNNPESALLIVEP